MAQRIEIILTPEFKDSYQKLPERIQRKVDKQIRFLSKNPKHHSLQMHRLNGDWEFYVDIHYRCFFERDGNTFILHLVGTHRMVDRYKNR